MSDPAALPVAPEPGPAATPRQNHLYLVDGSGYIFRAYHKLPPMTDPAGTPVNAVYGFTTMVWKLIEDLNDAEHPTHLAVILDAARHSFRNDIYPDYKANRPEPPEDLRPQFPLIRDAVRAFSVPCIESPGFEADDIIASYARAARAAGFEVTIVSSDKDLMQLVGPGVELLDTLNNRRLREEAVVEKFGVGPDKVIEVQALMGDSVDNVPGVPGIGPKTAAELIQHYGDVETLLAHAHEIKQPKRRENLIQFADLARVSKQLVTLKDDVPLPVPLDELTLRHPPHEPMIAFFDKHGFRSLKAKINTHHDAALAGDGTAADAAGGAVPFDTGAYECVTTLDRLGWWVAQATRLGVVAVDTETTSLDALRAELVGVSLALAPGQACYIPLGHTGSGGGLLAERPAQIPLVVALDVLRPLLADAGVLKIGQNLKYDMAVLARYDVTIVNFDDTMLLSYVLDNGRNSHGMDALSELHLGHATIKYADVCGSGKNQISFAEAPLDRATAYAAEDADVTWRLHAALKGRLWRDRMTTVYETLERPLVPVLVAMERAGILVDRTTLARLSGDFAQRMGALEAQIHQLAGEPFNVASPKQLGDILFDKMALKGGKKGKTGAWSTDADVLDGLAAEGVELAQRVLDWRQLAKLKSTYTDALQGQINPDTGRVHTSYAMASTSTGRLSSTDPNLQNIPVRTEEGRKIREAFVAPTGAVLLSADYSQIELRLLAHIADIPALKRAFADGIDIHAMTASEVFGVPVEGMDPMVRRQAKAINFGIIYGISAFGLARQLGIARGQAQAFIDRYFEKFPGIRAYMDATVAQCRKQGYVETLFGRRAYIATINDKNPNQRNFAERQAINAPIQGTAADIIRRAMIRMPAALDAAGLSAVKMLLQVHDELVFEAPESLAGAAASVITEVMSAAARPAVDIAVPLVVECGQGATWGAAH
ncbi:DNA polymerase I [Parapedomonas caeni]